MKVQWKNCLEWFGWSPRISNSRELKLTLGLREKMNKKLLNAKEWYSYRRKPLGRSCGLWYKENSVNKTLKELEPWKQNYPIGVEANNNAKRKEAVRVLKKSCTTCKQIWLHEQIFVQYQNICYWLLGPFWLLQIHSELWLDLKFLNDWLGILLVLRQR